MKQIDRYIPPAMQLVTRKLASVSNKGHVPAVYKGYISSMGASIVLSGLVPTLAFYNADTRDSGSEQPRRPLLDILHELLRDRYVLKNQDSLFDYALALEDQKKKTELRRLKRDVINASIALKLALRTFHLE